MTKLFELLFYGHVHQWEDICRENYWDTSYGLKVAKTIIVQKCTKCGKYRNDDVYGWVPELNPRRQK